MSDLHRYILASVLIFGTSLLVLGSCVVGYFREQRRLRKGRWSVVWKDTDAMFCAFTGTIRPVGEWHIVVEDTNGWPVVVDVRDIVELHRVVTT